MGRVRRRRYGPACKKRCGADTPRTDRANTAPRVRATSAANLVCGDFPAMSGHDSDPRFNQEEVKHELSWGPEPLPRRLDASAGTECNRIDPGNYTGVRSRLHGQRVRKLLPKVNADMPSYRLTAAKLGVAVARTKTIKACTVGYRHWPPPVKGCSSCRIPLPDVTTARSGPPSSFVRQRS